MVDKSNVIQLWTNLMLLSISAITQRCTNVVLMLGQRRRDIINHFAAKLFNMNFH